MQRVECLELKPLWLFNRLRQSAQSKANNQLKRIRVTKSQAPPSEARRPLEETVEGRSEQVQSKFQMVGTSRYDRENRAGTVETWGGRMFWRLFVIWFARLGLREGEPGLGSGCARRALDVET